MDAILRHGDFSQPYLDGNPRLLVRSDDLDRLFLPYSSPTRFAFARDTAAPDPYSHFTIVDIDAEQDADEWKLGLQCEGVDGGGDRIIGKPMPEKNLDDWDTCAFEVLTTNPEKYQPGLYLAGPWQTMLCTSAKPRFARGQWYKLAVSGMGLASPKERSRVITCNGVTISADSVTWNLPGGWNTPRKGVVDLPQIQVTDTYRGEQEPPTGEVPGSKVPPDAPPLKSLGAILVADATWYWPNGWKFTCTGKQVGNSSLWENQFIYTVQWAYLPA